ncbi:MAG: hypothetical protein F4139_10790 [Gemmatimonadetes bacterium]|nr:hypothetical protein [Gemmatimonadota bacterium]MYA64487.1 hypothetical protein [Gemmatimonadota bacterium]MYB97442.1 hypothetical protein [Gemmatimonadota bacterium]MYH53423.1 hypothetical protein [Gemmatimonadota bacterium]MYI45973.1 hypothetical protein [Gemmatimonadota bacterium]
MNRHRAILALPILLLACDDPTGVYDEPPDLSGLYRLVSWTSADWTDGVEATPPRVEGVLGITQHRATDRFATGEWRIGLRVNRPNGYSSGGLDGTYVNDSFGGMAAENMVSGKYTFEDGVLITKLSSPLANRDPPPLWPMGEAVWEPCPTCSAR